MIKDFVFFPDSSKNEKKVVCRYPQFFATHKLFDNIRLHSKLQEGGDGKGGTYFGATGCGKSITMLFLSRMLMRSKDFASPTIVLITDRTDLDDQLSKLFGTAKKFIGDECMAEVESRDKLREHLAGRTSGGVFLTTIHKFTEDTRLLSERANIICISDEAHRSQTNLSLQVRQTDKGVKRNYGFAKYLHDSLPNATYVGFTGTPVDATIDVFGEVVDAYTMTESVADGITRRIVYEGRAAKVLIDNKKLQEIELYYKQCAKEGANEYQIEESKTAVTKMERILGDSDRLQAVAEDFIVHYEKRVEEGSTVEGKAMFVCSNRTIAFDLYKKIIALRPQWAKIPGEYAHEDNYMMAAEPRAPYGHQELPIEKIKLIMTRSKDDEPELYNLLGTDEDRRAFAEEFKKPKSKLQDCHCGGYVDNRVRCGLLGYDVYRQTFATTYLGADHFACEPCLSEEGKRLSSGLYRHQKQHECGIETLCTRGCQSGFGGKHRAVCYDGERRIGYYPSDVWWIRLLCVYYRNTLGTTGLSE